MHLLIPVWRRGIAVRTDCQYSIMHDEFIVADGSTVDEGKLQSSEGLLLIVILKTPWCFVTPS